MNVKVIKPFGEDQLSSDALRISLCDINEGMVRAWMEFFGDVPAVEIVQDDIFKLRCDAIVSPANSFGDMDGGLDKLIDDFFNGTAQKKVKQAIAEQFYGELPVGVAIVVEMNDRRFPFLISAPTMRVPYDISDTINTYRAMRGLLVALLRYNSSHSKPIRSVVVPGLGTGVGRMSYRESAQQMRVAYNNVMGNGWRNVVYCALAPFALRR